MLTITLQSMAVSVHAYGFGPVDGLSGLNSLPDELPGLASTHFAGARTVLPQL
jgi:hypothetical protein